MSDRFPGGAKGRRRFLQAIGKGSLGAMLGGGLPGKSHAVELREEEGLWKPASRRKIRLGIAGFGASRFVAELGLQDHPNVEVVAVTDLNAERRGALREAVRCVKGYDSLELMVKDRRIDAILVATDAPNHARHSIEALNHGKDVLCAPPAVFGSPEEAEKLVEAVKRSGKKYMMAEPTCFRPDCHAMRTIYRAGGFGKIINAESESYQYSPRPADSYQGWRLGMAPMWDPTRVTAYYVGVTGKRLISVSCLGTKGRFPEYKPGKNRYENPFADELALFETSDGGSARMVKARSVQGHVQDGGRLFGEMGRMEGMAYHGALRDLPDVSRPALPGALAVGDRSYGALTQEFVSALLEDREPLVNVFEALAMTLPGLMAHESALKGGERLKIPQVTA
jgi:predicted dehydrogenase